MAYKPKFARGRAKEKKLSPVLIALGFVIVPLSLALTFFQLKQIGFQAGRPAPADQAALKDMAILQDFDAYLSQGLSAAEDALAAPDMPLIPEETVPPTLPPYEVIYTLEDDVQVAPEPNQALFGETDDPTTLTEVLKQAEYILDGQKLYFSTDVQIFAGSKVTYYLDDTIFAITWKEPRDKTVYTFSEVKIGHPSQLRRHLSDGAYGSGKLYLPTEMATTVNAVVATSGDFYANRPALGIMVHEGQIYRSVEDTYTETCYIDRNGDLIFSHMKELRDTKTAEAFIQEHDINFSLAFGPILVENYEVRQLPNVYSVGEIKEEYARSALCQMDKLHYLVAVANWEGNYPDDPTVAQFQRVIATTGCKMAYCLDGGQTATIVMNDKLINRPAKGEQRRISDILYFATAVPEGG